MSEWISIKDKLPELRQKVLVFVPDDMIRCDIGMIVGTAERQICNPPQTVWLLWGSDHRTADVTHWMLLPERPKLEGPFNFTDDAIEYTENGKVVAVLNVLAPAGWAMKDIIEWVNEVLVPKDSKKPFKPKEPFAVGYAGCLTDSPMNVSIGKRIFQIHATEHDELRKLVDRLNELWAKHKP